MNNFWQSNLIGLPRVFILKTIALPIRSVDPSLFAQLISTQPTESRTSPSPSLVRRGMSVNGIDSAHSACDRRLKLLRSQCAQLIALPNLQRLDANMLWRTLKILNRITFLLRVLNNLKRGRLGRLLWWGVSSPKLTRSGGRLRYLRTRLRTISRGWRRLRKRKLRS